jgi:hypothetical protein
MPLELATHTRHRCAASTFNRRWWRRVPGFLPLMILVGTLEIARQRVRFPGQPRIILSETRGFGSTLASLPKSPCHVLP